MNTSFQADRVFQYFSAPNESGHNSFRETIRESANSELNELWKMFGSASDSLVKTQALILFCMFSQDRQAIDRQDWLKSMTDFVKRNIPQFEVVGAAFSVADTGGVKIGWNETSGKLTEDFEVVSQLAILLSQPNFDATVFRGTVDDIFDETALNDFRESFRDALPQFSKLLRGEELSPGDRNPVKGMFEKLKFALTSIRSDLTPAGVNSKEGAFFDISVDALAARLTNDTQAATANRQRLMQLVGNIANPGQMLRN